MSRRPDTTGLVAGLVLTALGGLLLLDQGGAIELDLGWAGVALSAAAGLILLGQRPGAGSRPALSAPSPCRRERDRAGGAISPRPRHRHRGRRPLRPRRAAIGTDPPLVRDPLRRRRLPRPAASRSWPTRWPGPWSRPEGAHRDRRRPAHPRPRASRLARRRRGRAAHPLRPARLPRARHLVERRAGLAAGARRGGAAVLWRQSRALAEPEVAAPAPARPRAHVERCDPRPLQGRLRRRPRARAPRFSSSPPTTPSAASATWPSPRSSRCSPWP